MWLYYYKTGYLPKVLFSVSCLNTKKVFHRKLNTEKMLKFIQVVEHQEDRVLYVKHHEMLTYLILS